MRGKRKKHEGSEKLDRFLSMEGGRKSNGKGDAGLGKSWDKTKNPT